MSPNDGELEEEIDRIVNSPYPTELRTLRELLVSMCSNEDIARWVLSRPCQLDRLVECVLNGLRQWPYVLDIVTRLSHSAKARNAFLHREPTLLRDVIAQAIRNCIDSTYTAAAVALLSHPLPENVALPSEIQTFFIQLFDHAAQNPSVAGVRSIYQILSRTSTSLLPILSSNVLFRFEDHLFSILRNLKGDDPSLCLYTLAIMRILATASNELYSELPISSYDTQELLASTPASSSASKWQPETVKQYFTERKGQKTMQLIVLRVMWACTPTTGESIDEKMESLALANEIIAAVPTSERETWRKANTLVPKKFEEKVFAPGLEPGLRFQALCFLVRLGEGSVISPAVMNGIRQIVTNMDKLVEGLCDCNEQSMECITSCGVFDDNTTTTFLQNLVDFTASSMPEDMVQQSGLFVQLLRKLLGAMSSHDAISEGAMLALDVLSCGPKLHSLARLLQNRDQSSGRNSCGRAVQFARNELVHELCKLFLRAALSTSHQMYSIAPETLSLLLDIHASSAQSLPTCCHVKPHSTFQARPLPFVEAESTPHDVLDWRDALRSELNARNNSEYERLESVFVKACAELEARCQNVEKPLQEELKSKLALQERYDELQLAYEKLESEGIDRAVQFGGLEAERDRFQADLESVQEENTRLERRCQELEQRIQHVEAQALEDVGECRRLQQTAELEHAAEVAEKEGELEEMKEQMASMNDDFQSREQDLQRLRDERQDNEMKAQTSAKDFELLQTRSQEQQALIDRLTQERDATMAENGECKARISDLETEVGRKQEAHSIEAGQLKAQMNQALEEAADTHRLDLEKLSADHETETTSLKRKLSEMEDASRQAEESRASEIARRDNEISEYTKKLDRLNRKCEQKDRQIAEANAMRSNLMAAMGLGGQHAQINLPHRPSQSSMPQDRQRAADEEDDATPPTPQSAHDFETQEPTNGQSSTSNASSSDSRSGPTPKRLRPRRSARLNSPSQPTTSINNSARKSRSATKRQPLSSISANPSAKKQTATQNMQSSGKEIDPDETTFDGSELFAGTPAGWRGC